jgi:hypothetical protein
VSKTTLAALGMPEVSQKGRAIILNGLSGLEFVGTTSKGESAILHFYLSGQRVYGVFATSESLSNLDTFLSSFSIK